MRLPMPENELTPEEEALQVALLKRAVERLKSFIERGGPVQIICRESVIVCKRAILLYGVHYWKAWHDDIIGVIRNDAGLCATCKGGHHVGESSCPQCIADGDEYVDALDRDEPKGPPCQ